MGQLTLDSLMVLLVEPSLTQRRIVEGLLGALGVSDITAVVSGADALAQMHRYCPDLVISALYLPDMTGTDLVHAMRADAELAATAFMLISSETRFRYLDPIRQAGAIAILPKPFGRDALRVALINTLDSIDSDRVDLAGLDPETLEVLIVDDSKLARGHIRRTLATLGFERFTEARDGVEALGQLQSRYFDLVVTDYNMPRMDGKELIEQIRTDSTQAAVPVLMVTSEENEGRLAAVQRSGVSAICDKPFAPTTLRSLLFQLLST